MNLIICQCHVLNDLVGADSLFADLVDNNTLFPGRLPSPKQVVCCFIYTLLAARCVNQSVITATTTKSPEKPIKTGLTWCVTAGTACVLLVVATVFVNGTTV